jgi:hypothetical protein
MLLQDGSTHRWPISRGGLVGVRGSLQANGGD